MGLNALIGALLVLNTQGKMARIRIHVRETHLVLNTRGKRVRTRIRLREIK